MVLCDMFSHMLRFIPLTVLKGNNNKAHMLRFIPLTVLKGNNNKALSKMFFSVYTQSLILYVLHTNIFQMRLTCKGLIKFEVNEISDYVVL